MGAGEGRKCIRAQDGKAEFPVSATWHSSIIGVKNVMH